MNRERGSEITSRAMIMDKKGEQGKNSIKVICLPKVEITNKQNNRQAFKVKIHKNHTKVQKDLNLQTEICFTLKI